jgi:hypothetical protein
MIFTPPESVDSSQTIGVALTGGLNWYVHKMFLELSSKESYYFFRILSQQTIRFSKSLTAADKRLLYLSCLVYPYHGYYYTDRRKEEPAVKFVIRESLKVLFTIWTEFNLTCIQLRSDDAECVALVHQNVQSAIDKVNQEAESKISRKDLGKGFINID